MTWPYTYKLIGVPSNRGLWGALDHRGFDQPASIDAVDPRHDIQMLLEKSVHPFPDPLDPNNQLVSQRPSSLPLHPTASNYTRTFVLEQPKMVRLQEAQLLAGRAPAHFPSCQRSSSNGITIGHLPEINSISRPSAGPGACAENQSRNENCWWHLPAREQCREAQRGQGVGCWAGRT